MDDPGAAAGDGIDTPQDSDDKSRWRSKTGPRSGGWKAVKAPENQTAEVVREHPGGVLWNTGGMYRVEFYAQVRRSVYVEGISEREAAQRYGLARETVRKMLRDATPPGYQRRQPVRRPKLDPFTAIIDQILESDREQPSEQRATERRIKAAKFPILKSLETFEFRSIACLTTSTCSR